MSNKTRVFIVVVEVLLAAAIYVPSGVMEFFIHPFRRGFFCNDESLMHPYKGDTISTALVAVLSFLIPLCVIVPIELLISYRNAFGIEESASPPACFGRRFPGSVVAAFRYMLWLTFAIGVTMLITDLTKYSIGRLRPHFFDVCGFRPSSVNCTGGYIITFKCSDTFPKRLKEARLSFPSGHSSISAVAMVFTALYVHYRLRVPGVTGVKPFLQAVLVSLAVLCACSRVSDYMHHWSDVLAGFGLGIAVAFVIACACTDLPKWRQQMLREEELRNACDANVGLKELGTTSSVVNIP